MKRVLTPEELRRDFIPKILHGSKEHRAWLVEAFEAYFTGKEIPKERN